MSFDFTFQQSLNSNCNLSNYILLKRKVKDIQEKYIRLTSENIKNKGYNKFIQNWYSYLKKEKEEVYNSRFIENVWCGENGRITTDEGYLTLENIFTSKKADYNKLKTMFRASIYLYPRFKVDNIIYKIKEFELRESFSELCLNSEDLNTFLRMFVYINVNGELCDNKSGSIDISNIRWYKFHDMMLKFDKSFFEKIYNNYHELCNYIAKMFLHIDKFRIDCIIISGVCKFYINKTDYTSLCMSHNDWRFNWIEGKIPLLYSSNDFVNLEFTKQYNMKDNLNNVKNSRICLKTDIEKLFHVISDIEMQNLIIADLNIHELKFMLFKLDSQKNFIMFNNKVFSFDKNTVLRLEENYGTGNFIGFDYYSLIIKENMENIIQKELDNSDIEVI
jgi:hypothetical protein